MGIRIRTAGTAMALAFGLTGTAAAQEAEVSRSKETGRVTFIRTDHGKPIKHAHRGTPAERARGFLRDRAKDFGLREDASDAHVKEIREPGQGRSSVRFQQKHGGVPVIGGELIVNLDSAGDVLSASGEVSPDVDVDTKPRITADEARQAATEAVAKQSGHGASALTADEPKLGIYDNRLLGGPGLDRPVLVWETVVEGADVEERVFVDATTGGIALRYSERHEAKSRKICDGNNTNNQQVPCTTASRSEGGAASTVTAVNQAYDWAGVTYDFLRNTFGRDSIDGKGMPLVATVRACLSTEACPMGNAYWSNNAALFGQAWLTDDIVAHEFTHGLTQFTANLFYYYQSGAINESMSDVFGEWIDFATGTNDTAAGRWLVGEDRGAIRDMEHPPTYSHPDRMLSSLWTSTSEDAGGVHTNSGVGNKTAFLITDGGTFNGYTITGLGVTKAARVYYEALLTQLTSGSDYYNLHNALQQACNNLQGTYGVTASDCTQVRSAVLATQMDTWPSTAAISPAPCPTSGTSPVNVWFDDLENGGSRWTTDSPNWYKTAAWYVTSGRNGLHGAAISSLSDNQIQMLNAVTIPSGAYLHFNHAFGFESGYDGGVIEYSVAGGAWTDAGPLIEAGKYTKTVNPYSANALKGRAVWGGKSGGMGSSRLNLGSLAGKSVKFRFRFGTDGSIGDDGWFIDDVRIHTCSADTVRPVAQAPAAYFVTGWALSSTDPATASVQSEVSWGNATDDRSPATKMTYKLQRVFRGGEFADLTGWTTRRSFPVTLRLGQSVGFRVLVKDEAGNVGEASSPIYTPGSVQEDAFAKSTGWGTRFINSTAFGEYLLPSETQGVRAIKDVSGVRSVGLVMPRHQNMGNARLCLELTDSTTLSCTTVDLSPNTSFIPRYVAWTRAGLNPATTYRISVTNAGGRIELDGLLML